MIFKWSKVNKIKAMPKSFYSKLFIYIGVIAILPVLIIGTLSYINVKKALENEMRVWNSYVLENSKNAFELNFNQMLYQSGYLIANNITYDYESLYNANAYESLGVSAFNGDLNGLNEYLFYKKNMIKMMSSIQMNNKYIDDIYFYDSEKNMILTSDGHQYTKESFYDKDGVKAQANSKALFSRMDIKTVNKGGNLENIVTLVYRTVNKNNSFIVNINVGKLFNSTFHNLPNPKDDNFIYSQEANKLIDSNNQANAHILSDLGGPEKLIAMGEKNRILKDHFLVSWVKSERLGWYFINVKDLRNYYINLQKSENLVLVSSSLLLLIFLILSSFVSNRIYSPFKRLILEKLNIQNKFNENKPVLQNIFLYELIKGKSYSSEETKLKMNGLNLQIPDRDLVVLLIQCDGENNKFIQEVFERFLFSQSQGFCLDVDGQLCFVVQMPLDNMKLLDVAVQTIKIEIRARLEVPVAVGVSRLCENLGELNRAYFEALEALKHRFVCGPDEIIFYDDIKLSSQKHINYPAEKEKALRNCILTGNIDEARSILKKIIDELTDPPNTLSYTKLQQSFNILLSGIIKTVDMLGIDIDDIMGSDTDYYETISHSSNKEHLYTNFFCLLEKIMEYVSVEKTNKTSKDMNKIISFIEKNYQRDISLVDVAGVVDLNPSYVSRLIKNHIGKSFTDFVSDKRIAEAENLLLTTNLKLDGICQKVGYQNTYYFIKVFRKYYGTTPAKYRESQCLTNNESAVNT
jgi:two-component system response regulator YesN